MARRAAKKARPSRSWGARVLDGIERVGNRLPDPVTLFVLAILIVIVLSSLLAGYGVTAIHPSTKAEIPAVSFFSTETLRRFLVEMPQTFAQFPPLGIVLMVMLGVGVAERTGLIAFSLGALVRAVPRQLLTATIVFTGVMSSLAADAGYVVLVPLAAALYASSGRHPLAGLAAAVAGVSGGFSANLLITPLDPLLVGFTQAAAQLVDPDYVVPVTANYFLMIALVPLFTAAGTWVTERIIVPRLAGNPDLKAQELAPEPAESASGRRRSGRGLLAAGVVLLLVAGVVASMAWAPGAPLRGDDGGFDPLLRSLVSVIFIAFLLSGIVFGLATRAVRSDRDVVRMMAATMSDMGMYIVLAFFAAQFVALFAWSNLGAITAINGAEALKATGFVGLPLLLALVLLVLSINILIGSASAKWAILAPIFVPMLMLVGISPEATQAAYRIGDSITNPITPLIPYFPLVLIVAQRYVPSFGIGSLVALMLPYSVVFGISSTLLFAVWVALDIPYWPGIDSVYGP